MKRRWASAMCDPNKRGYAAELAMWSLFPLRRPEPNTCHLGLLTNLLAHESCLLFSTSSWRGEGVKESHSVAVDKQQTFTEYNEPPRPMSVPFPVLSQKARSSRTWVSYTVLFPSLLTLTFTMVFLRILWRFCIANIVSVVRASSSCFRCDRGTFIGDHYTKSIKGK